MKNNVPFVSVLIPVYKVPEIYLRKCLDSVINQTLKNIEIIIVDDGSPDNCGAICDEYALNDNRVKVIHKENGGLASARNAAFEKASGECITFLDGDDFLENNACELAFKTLKDNNVQMVFWNQITEYSHSSEIVKTFGDDDIIFFGDECKELQLRVLNFNGKIAQAFSKLILRDFLLKYNIKHIDELKQGAEGFVFNIALFEHVESAYYLNKELLHYRYNNQSISHTPNEENYYLIVRCFEYIYEYIQNSNNKEELEKQLYNRMLYVVVTTGITGYFNPVNNLTYTQKINGYKKFLNESLIKKSLQIASTNGIGMQRKIIILLVKLKQFWAINLLGKIRRQQLDNK